MIARAAHDTLLRLVKGFPVLAFTGPRQSGKTTLAKAAFPDKPYLSLEDPDVRMLAESDPRGLLSRFPDGAILDEVQRAPSLFSYLQTSTDQLLNLSTLAADCGISHSTASAWISVLEASYIAFLLRPHSQNFNKRLVKTPKLYFCDTGLASWLLGIRDPGQIAFHAQRGALFENLVVTEFLKTRLHRGQPPDLHFWRDSQGLEVDLLVERGGDLNPVEVKSGQTIAADFFQALNRWKGHAGLAGLRRRPAAPQWKRGSRSLAGASGSGGQPVGLVVAGTRGQRSNTAAGLARSSTCRVNTSERA